MSAGVIIVETPDKRFVAVTSETIMPEPAPREKKIFGMRAKGSGKEALEAAKRETRDWARRREIEVSGLED